MHLSKPRLNAPRDVTRRGSPVTLRSVAIVFLLFALLGVGPLRSVESAWARVDQPPNKKKKRHDKKPKQGRGKKKADMKAVPPDEAAEEAALQDLGEGFKLHRTRHYSVLSDTSEKDVKAFSIAIEKTYRSCVNYTLKLGLPAKPPKTKLIIFYFQEHQAYSDYSERIHVGPQPQSTPGLYVPALNRSLFYNFRNQSSFKQAREQAERRIAELKDRMRRGNVGPPERKRMQAEIRQLRRQANHSKTQGGEISESTVQHEVSHQVLWNVGLHNPRQFGANPRWFVEGTAMMFEPISTGHSANFGALNKERLQEFREVKKSGRLIPLRKFISSAEAFGPNTIAIAYPEAWALVHYLNRARRKRLKKYIELLNTRPKGYQPDPDREVADFESVFGKLDKKWEQRWQKWVSRIR